jgi:hypothetical protein
MSLYFTNSFIPSLSRNLLIPWQKYNKYKWC